ncbi:MAG: sigma-70 family RNA polymerase sigma factor [Planctomycetes bacterium]|nr:sigma-70 family RNA polymerase sigma factor [Planctomycetota bacterium]NOG53502.1 sigma-70 family RNA polymerase sigma factor [Planctomycetota bacterium]
MSRGDSNGKLSPGGRRLPSGLNRPSRADQTRIDEMFAHLYPELQRLADRHMRHERSDHTLQSTALVNEAYLKLCSLLPETWSGESDFRAAVSRAMYQVLVDYARRKEATKRGKGRFVLALNESVSVGLSEDVDVLHLNDSMEELLSLEPRSYQVVIMRFIGGMTIPEVAGVLGVSARTIERDWQFARSWLRREMRRGDTQK